MKKIWHLSTCDTCKRISKELELKKRSFEFQDIKKENISASDLDMISKQSKLSYEDLFNKRAQKYTKTNLKQDLKSEEDFRKAILEEYTFLKRPVIQVDDKFFVGNSKKVVEEAKILIS